MVAFLNSARDLSLASQTTSYFKPQSPGDLLPVHT